MTDRMAKKITTNTAQDSQKVAATAKKLKSQVWSPIVIRVTKAIVKNKTMYLNTVKVHLSFTCGLAIS